MTTQKLIIDTDPGIDDAMAMHYAFAESCLNVIGITSVFGNVYTDQATRNALFLVEQACYPTTVVGGAQKPLTQPLAPPSHYVHGPEGLGDMPAPTPTLRPASQEASSFLFDQCQSYSGDVILCAVGPLTNIAHLLQTHPQITHHVKKLVIMGGAVWTDGNVNQWAEANIWHDPHAADSVFAADWDIDLISLDVTRSIRCSANEFAGLVAHSPKIGQFLKDISAFYIQFYQASLKQKLCLLHDVVAVIATIEREWFSFQSTPLQVICSGSKSGQTIVDTGTRRRPVHVAVSADVDKIKARFLDICKEADMMVEKRKEMSHV